MITLLGKVWFDLWQDKTRTIQVVLVIALGAIGVGLVIGARNIIADSIAEGSVQSQAPHIRLSVSPPLTQDQLERLGRIEGVYQAEGIQSAPIEWRLVGDSEWQTGVLNGRDNYLDQKMSLDGLVSGQWPSRNTLGVGQITVGENGALEGDMVEIRFGETTRTLPIVATMDPIGPVPVFQETFYANGRTFTRITGLDTYNLVQTRDTEFIEAKAFATDQLIQDYFAEIGVDSVGVSFPFQDRVVPPDVPPAQAILNAIFLLLGVLGLVVVILGVFLVYNSVNAIVAQQVTQIGVMKAIGASSRQVLASYLLLILSYGFLAAVISIPIGAVAALGLQNLFVQFLNLESYVIRVDATAVTAQILISLLAPLLAALVPLRAGMNITVREAISTYGLTGSAGLIDRMVTRAINVPYIILLTIGNTFRNRRRVVIIEFALIVAGTIFMMVLGVNDATAYTFGNKLAEVQNYQVTLALEGTERTQELAAIAADVDNVARMESWLVLGASARPATQTEREVTDARVRLFGQPPETTFFQPEILAGRWLAVGDRDVVVVSQQVATNKGWQVGDRIVLESGNGRELAATIVGILFDPAINTSVHVPLGWVQQEWRYFGKGNAFFVQTLDQTPEAQLTTAVALEQTFEQNSLRIAPSSIWGAKTMAEITATAGDGFAIILSLLGVMAVVIALIGGVGLSGILSLSVLERRREIGVMRAIGASSWQVIRLFVGEGILLGLLSWSIALPLSIPAAYFFTTQGLSLALNQQLVYQFTPVGAITWLVIITVLAIVASAWPARGAAKISVRESLAYS